MSEGRPLFIPLKAEHYYAFATGKKDHELRLYGPRWNYQTCYIGRPVILSKGYGKKGRLTGVVLTFERVKVSQLTKKERDDIDTIYRLEENRLIARIGIGGIERT